MVVASVIAAIKADLNTHADPDESLNAPLKRWLKSGPVFNLMQFDMRMWVFCLFANKIKSENYIGEQHFWYANKDDAKGNALGFIFLMAFEIPIAHLVLHFAMVTLWLPMLSRYYQFLDWYCLLVSIVLCHAAQFHSLKLT